MKLVINHIMSIHTCAFSEGLALGKKAGLDPDQMARTIRNSVLGYMHVYKPRSIVEKNYAPTFSVDYMLKDMRLISEVAESARSPIPLGALCRQMYTGAAAAGSGGRERARSARCSSAGPVFPLEKKDVSHIYSFRINRREIPLCAESIINLRILSI